jgi:hypothetical protein
VAKRSEATARQSETKKIPPQAVEKILRNMGFSAACGGGESLQHGYPPYRL